MVLVINNNVLAFCTVLAIGYVVIVISLMFKETPAHDNNELASAQYQLELLRKDVNMKNAGLSALQAQLKSMQEKMIAPSAEQKAVDIPKAESSKAIRPGVIVLGMHRSGTSILGGLMSKMGLATGHPLIHPASDNEKGFFERIDVVLENDELMKKQNVHYAWSTFRFDPLKAVSDIVENRGKNGFFKEGERGLAFLNNPSNYPWMLKDPRLCITLRAWFPFLKFIPSVLFTYRHPMDVALSLNKRAQEHLKMYQGLQMWYVYNRRAIQQSNDLCRVVTSHRKIMSTPKEELDRIYSELRDCGVNVPHPASVDDISSFIDMSLQHGKSTLVDDSCTKDVSQLLPPPSWGTTDTLHVALYREVMRAYCAMEDGSAFKPGFQWNESIKDA